MKHSFILDQIANFVRPSSAGLRPYAILLSNTRRYFNYLYRFSVLLNCRCTRQRILTVKIIIQPRRSYRYFRDCLRLCCHRVFYSKAAQLLHLYEIQNNITISQNFTHLVHHFVNTRSCHGNKFSREYVDSYFGYFSDK